MLAGFAKSTDRPSSIFAVHHIQPQCGSSIAGS